MIAKIIIGGAILLVLFVLATWVMIDSCIPDEKRRPPRRRRRRKKKQAEVIHIDRTHEYIQAAWDEVQK